MCFPHRVGRKVGTGVVREAFEKAGFRRVLEDGEPRRIEEAHLHPENGVVQVVLDRVAVEHERAPEDRGLSGGRAAPRRRARRAAGRGRGPPPPVQRGPALRGLRPRLRRPLARPLLVQPPGGRLRDLQGLRPHHGDRPGPRDPRRAQDDRPGLREALPDQVLQRLPERSRALRPARGPPHRRALGGAARGDEAPRVGRGARRPRELAEEVVRDRGLLPVAGVAGLPDARAGLPLALPLLPLVPRLRRLAPQGRGAALPARRAVPPRGRGAAGGRGRARLPRVDRAREGPGLGAAPLRGARAAALPRGRGPRLPDPRAPVADPLGRRGPARHPGHRPRRLAHQHALRPRRAVGGPAPAGRFAPVRRAAPAGRRRQCRGGCRARRGADLLRRPRDRPRPGARPGGRRGRLRGPGRGPPRRAPLENRDAPRGASFDAGPREASEARPRPAPPRPGCAREQPQGHHGRDPPRPAGVRDRRLGVGQVLARGPGAPPQPAPALRPRRVRAGRLRRDRRGGPPHRGHARGPGPPRRVLAGQRRHVHGSPRAAPQGLREDARGARPRPEADLASRSTPRPGRARCARARATRRWRCSSCPTPS